MAEKIDSKVTYFLLGVGVGSLVGILFAPKTGEETREYLSQNVQKKVRGLQESAEDVIERGKEVVSQEKEKIAAAVKRAARPTSGRNRKPKAREWKYGNGL